MNCYNDNATNTYLTMTIDISDLIFFNSIQYEFYIQYTSSLPNKKALSRNPVEKGPILEEGFI